MLQLPHEFHKIVGKLRRPQKANCLLDDLLTNMGRLPWSQIFLGLNKPHFLSLSLQGKSCTSPPSYCLSAEIAAIFPVQWVQNRMKYSRLGLMLSRGAYSTRNAPVNTAQNALAFFAVRAHCWLKLLLLPAKAPRSFQQSCSPAN